ncbi:MAG: anti-sigma-factor antagonist [Frankiales bacterium]|jgi:anti-anti-sigma factor|nr:anti-sigma-factor antagonist [Frankiales bacterium]
MTAVLNEPLAQLAVEGDLDARALPRFCASLQELLAGHPARLVLDLSQCAFVDAAALAALLEAHRTTARYGGELVLAGCTPRVLRLLCLTGLGRVFTLR